MVKATTDKIRAASSESKKSAAPPRLNQTKLPFDSLSQPSQNKKVEDVPQAPGGGWTITKTKAREEYHLLAKDLEDLHSETKSTHPKNGVPTGRPMILYREQDVERKAWELHGGKRQFVDHLKMLLKKHKAKKKKNDEGSFKVPNSYRNDVLGRPAAAPGPSQPVQQATQPTQAHIQIIPLSPVLSEIKDSMAPWLWDRCMAELERWDRVVKRQGQPGLRGRLEIAMRHAQTFATTYPPRPPPTHVPTKSPWTRVLHATLAEAPRIPHNSQEPVEGIVPFGKTPIGSSLKPLYDWDDAYLRRVFVAVASVVRMHGTGEAGWASVRWVVYDTYVDCVRSAIIYSPKRGEWFDPAARWLTEEYRVRGPGREYLQRDEPKDEREPEARPKIPSPTNRTAGGASSM